MRERHDKPEVGFSDTLWDKLAMHPDPLWILDLTSRKSIRRYPCVYTHNESMVPSSEQSSMIIHWTAAVKTRTSHRPTDFSPETMRDNASGGSHRPTIHVRIEAAVILS